MMVKIGPLPPARHSQNKTSVTLQSGQAGLNRSDNTPINRAGTTKMQQTILTSLHAPPSSTQNISSTNLSQQINKSYNEPCACPYLKL